MKQSTLIILLIALSISACVSSKNKGVVGMKRTDKPIVVEQTYKVERQTVWKAITKPEELKQWLFNTIEEFEPRVGFETLFVVEVEGVKYPHRWKVTQADDNKKIQYSWKYDGFSGAAIVTFELSEEAESKTRLQLTYRAVEDFSHEENFTRKVAEEGWTFLIQESLKKYLEKE